MTARTLMIQGVASSVGKSVLTAALCRIYARRGVRVAPFKAQNMSNNAAVTADGEIGRAQALQARAAGVEPTVRMNPVLLKPEFGARSQVVVLGRATERRNGRDYLSTRETLWPVVSESLGCLRAEYDLVIIEGAGSPAEVNLKPWDIVNMRVARHVGAPVLLVADVDRGGSLAALVGTMELLEPDERPLVRGFLVNRFRGDRTLFEPATRFLRERTGVPVLGVVPEIERLRLPSEDSATLDGLPGREGDGDVVAIRLPRVSNFDDLDPLASAGVVVRWVADARDFGAPGLVVLPGSKSTRADMEFLWASGLAASIRAAAYRGAVVLGVCGGFQMLGRELVDPHGLEGTSGATPGLGLLDARTTFYGDKLTRQSSGRVIATAGPLAFARGSLVRGYEIHDGVTDHAEAPLLQLGGERGERLDGAISASGRVIGTYLHGILNSSSVCQALVGQIGLGGWALDHEDLVDQELDRLADVVQEYADMAAIDALVGLS